MRNRHCLCTYIIYRRSATGLNAEEPNSIHRTAATPATKKPRYPHIRRREFLSRRDHTKTGFPRRQVGFGVMSTSRPLERPDVVASRWLTKKVPTPQSWGFLCVKLAHPRGAPASPRLNQKDPTLASWVFLISKVSAWRPSADTRRNYLMIFTTVPAPTVRPPSRMAKPRPSSMAMG